MRGDPPAILVLNAGSSSIKFALYRADLTPLARPVIEGEIDGLGVNPALTVYDALLDMRQRFSVPEASGPHAHGAALDLVLHRISLAATVYHIVAVGHRVVHGGVAHAEPVVITPDVLAQLETLTSLAPLHQPHNLAAIRGVTEQLPGVLQVASFDTAFHRTCDERAQRFALPRHFHDEGIRRYGFHGLSYEHIAAQLPRVCGAVPRRTVVAHLGAGASLCALQDGRSVATTMGFTALDGLMMGSRCGSIDPGVILYFLGQRHMTLEAVQRMLYHESGLLGVSAVSGDMRVLLESTQASSHEAVALFCYRVVREIGSLAAALGGLDALVFTAGIGERAHPVRAAICEPLAWLGVALDATANVTHGPLISSPGSAVSVWVIPTDEQGVIARHTKRILG